MPEKTVAILGSTGLIGHHLLDLLLADNDVDTVRILVRRPVQRTHPKLEVKLVNFEDLESVKLAIDGCQAVFCAIGTTQKKVKGDRQQYLKIDFDIPVKTARLCKEVGCETFAIVTAVGANSKSGNFYLKLKGHVEDAIKLIGLQSVHIFQPSQLLGDRKESRPLEWVFMGLGKVFSPLLLGSWRRFRPIKAETVAKAMVAAARLQTPGFYRYTYDAILNLETKDSNFQSKGSNS